MGYARPIKATLKAGYENLAGLIAVSLGITLAFLPLAVAGVVGTPLAVLGGLWATCLLLGIGLVAAFRFTTVVAARGVSIDLRPAVVPAVADPTLGLKVGVVTFGAILAAVLLVVLSPDAYRSIAVGVAAFLLAFWYLLAAFAAPELGAGRPLASALRAGGARLAASPGRAAAFLALTAVCALVTGLTVVTMALLLPGVLALLAARLTLAVDGDADR